MFNKRTLIKNVLLLSLLFSLLLIPSIAFSQETDNVQKPEPEKLKNILTNFEEYAEEAMEEWGTPGMAIAIVSENEVIYSKGFGVKKIGEMTLLQKKLFSK